MFIAFDCFCDFRSLDVTHSHTRASTILLSTCKHQFAFVLLRFRCVLPLKLWRPCTIPDTLQHRNAETLYKQTNTHSILILLKCFMDYSESEKWKVFRSQINIDWLDDAACGQFFVYWLWYQSLYVRLDTVGGTLSMLTCDFRMEIKSQRFFCTHFTWFTKHHCHGNKGFHSIRSWTEIFSAFSNIQSWRWIDSSALKCMILDTFAPFYCHHAENQTVLITTFRWNWSAQYFADPSDISAEAEWEKYSNLSPCLSIVTVSWNLLSEILPCNADRQIWAVKSTQIITSTAESQNKYMENKQFLINFNICASKKWQFNCANSRTNSLFVVCSIL